MNVDDKTVGASGRLLLASLALVALGAPAIAGDPEALDRGETLASVRKLLARAGAALEASAADEARPLYLEAIAKAETLGAPTLLLARAVDALGDLERDAEHPRKAIDCYSRSIELFDSLLGPRQPRVAVSLHNLGVLHLERGEVAEAEPPLRRAYGIWVQSFGEDSAQAVNTARALARIEAGKGTTDDPRPESPVSETPERREAGSSHPPL